MQITSVENKQVKALTKLNQKKYRKVTNTYLIFGENSLSEGLKMGKVKQIITTNLDYENSLVEVMYVDDRVMEKISMTKPAPKFCAVASFEFQDNFKAEKVLVLDDLQDPGNVGTILRTARALGIKDVFLSNDTVDVFNPRVVKAMQGIEFHLNFYRGKTIEFLSGLDLPIITTFLDEENELEQKLNEFALVIGNEGNGISTEVKSLEHINAKIEIDFESINVAVATGIILYKLS